MAHLTFPIRSDQLTMTVEVTETLADFNSEFQNITIVETAEFGRALLLDNHIQLTTRDEYAYHESLVHIPLLNLNNPTKALVVGGGDGGVLRELVKHDSLTQIDMVEIDQSVVDLCKQHLPTLSNGAFDDPRVNLHIEDAFNFVKYADDKYDLIIVDATDVYEEESGELSENLFTEVFYTDCRNALSSQGIVVTQADNLIFCPYSLASILEDFEKSIGPTGSYWCLVPSFGGFSGFAWASPNAILSPEWPQNNLKLLKYLNPLTYQLAFTSAPFPEN